MAVLRDFSLPDHFIEGIIFNPGDKVDSLGRSSAKKRNRHYSPVHRP